MTSLDRSPSISPTLSPLQSLTSSLLPTVTPSQCKPVREHSLMAPHEVDSLSMCTDDLQSLFELAQVLFRVGSQAKPRGQKVVCYSSWSFVSVNLVTRLYFSYNLPFSNQEQRSWFRLVHCYLLPLVTFSADDLQSVEEVKREHMRTLAALDQAILAITTQTMQVSCCVQLS